MAALRTVVNGGLIPHARQGGRCVAAVAVAGSRLDGTGLENEQIGQIQVALTGFGEGGLVDCDRVDNDFTECRLADDGGTAGLVLALGDPLALLFFCGLGYIVTLGEDLRKPA